MLTKKIEAYTGLISVRYPEGDDLSSLLLNQSPDPNILPTREACHVFVASIIMNVAKITQWLQKGWSRFKNLKIHFLPTVPPQPQPLFFLQMQRDSAFPRFMLLRPKRKKKRERRGPLKLFVSALPRGGAERWRTER